VLKKVILSAILVCLLFLAGCKDKPVTVEPSTPSEVQPVGGSKTRVEPAPVVKAPSVVMLADPMPADGATDVALSADFSWSKGQYAQADKGYQLFIGTDETKVADAFYRNHANVKVYEVSSPEFSIDALDAETTYFWKIDQVNETLAPGLWKGKVWSFTTAKAEVGEIFADEFSVNHNFVEKGTEGTSWDGFIGLGEQETVEQLEVADGVIHFKSAKGRYEGGAKPLGPLLYKTVKGDFKVTVKIADYQMVSFNNCGLMARVADFDDAGKGEDWVSVDYFPLYRGIYGRMTDENRRSENANCGQGKNANKYLQLELIGNMFYQRHSADGIEWQELPCGPVVRNDMTDLPLQVGIFQCTFSENMGHVAFDDFNLEIGGVVKTARNHFPEDGAIDIPMTSYLSWVPGSGADGHEVYFGDSYQAIKNADNNDASVFKGRQESNNVKFDISGLKDGEVYYWRIDEASGDEISKGPVWSFTTYNRDLTDFAGYESSDELTSKWIANGTGRVDLTNDALQLKYNNADAPHYAKAEYVFDVDQDWMTSDYSFRTLSVKFKSNTSNANDTLYMVLEDNDWGQSQTVVEYDGDLKKGDWTTWTIDLQQLVESNPAFRLLAVKKMAIAVGNPEAATAGNAGSVEIAGIRIDYKKGDEPKYVDPSKFVKAVPFSDVTVTGGIWQERMEVNRKVSLPHVWGRCETSTKANGQVSKRLDNFRKVAGEMEGDFSGTFFNDSDVYKIIQGTAYTLSNHPDPELEAYTDKVIDSIAGSQWEDGYLFTHYSLPKRMPERRWTNVGHMHELYCAGHMFEAGVAYYQATGKRKLLDVSIKFADLICDTFGPGKRLDAPGHQEIELALIDLYEVTGNETYLETSKFFIDQRGDSRRERRYGTYSQDHIPFVEQEKGVGHSVRGGYLFCAAADVVMITHDEAYANAMYRLWDNITNTKTYLTGGIGQPGGPEGFAADYELSNGCYSETCSGIAFSMWNQRLHQINGESKHIDIVERTLYNNMLHSLSFEGDKHYYTNPLTTGSRERWHWPGHDCACCPSSLVRTISSISGYAYTHNEDTINVNMYMQSDGKVKLGDNAVGLKQTTNYPWDGDIKIDVSPEKDAKFAIKLRVPGWAQNAPMPGNLYKYLDENTEPVTVALNGKAIDADVQDGYITIDRKWQKGDKIALVLPMTIRRVVAHPKATADKGLVAIERGPIVFCAESIDNSFDVSELKLADSVKFTAKFEKDFFAGAVTLASDSDPQIKLIPSYLSENRGQKWMRIWMPRVK
jgi:DUF1680 family protein/regulation of enolase protein 1 (concanavalin A-like superfamily)